MAEKGSLFEDPGVYLFLFMLAVGYWGGRFFQTRRKVALQQQQQQQQQQKKD